MNSQAPRTNVLIHHPDPILSAGLVAALRQHGMFEVFVHGVDNLGADGPVIDVVIADYEGAMRHLESPGPRSMSLWSRARVLALTANDRENDIRRAIEAGIHGYVLVGGAIDELVDAVSHAAGGLRFMSHSVAQRMADSLTRAVLTAREIEVLTLVASGQPNKSIARTLSIELTTVKSHISAILGKLGATTRTQAARIAASRGLVGDYALASPLAALPLGVPHHGSALAV
ncbi:DNA-binding response regulator [Variovorax sp. OV329]|uniref:response regulator transcription factor n=1 Tax=Variovorax sp. OV329 TaxID=1882825 RepID=UPI0008EB82BB|nr:response regulator transcription factor [Variovorax sp. OV329]SFM20517.1 DNA-binding response regulator, NarL/FixJ family, contains REC and HTH domains [Variovorax sp. OV329]